MKDISTLFRYISIHFKALGREGVRKALILWYALRSNNTPMWAKSVILVALVYLVTPLDAIPDFLPLGLADDLSVLVATALQIAHCIAPSCVSEADRQTRDWFGS